MGVRSLEKGFMGDALKYLHAANEDDPKDFEVMLKLGWAYNTVKDDRTADTLSSISTRRSAGRRSLREASRASSETLRPAVRTLANNSMGVPHDLDALGRYLRLRSGQSRTPAAPFSGPPVFHHAIYRRHGQRRARRRRIGHPSYLFEHSVVYREHGSWRHQCSRNRFLHGSRQAKL